MKKAYLPLLSAFLLSVTACVDSSKPSLILLCTTDVHGTFFPFDFVGNRESDNSLASVSSYFNEVRSGGNSVIALDNGDILQGQPEVYYYNYIDTASDHLCASILNYMKYDVATVGNHDIEAGHSVYDRIRQLYNFPMLASNAVSTVTGEPYFKPYTLIRKNGLDVAVLGLITPSVPDWLPPVLYSGIRFEDMTITASKWMEEIKGLNPDIIVGLFHSGWDDESESPEPGNSSAAVVYNVPGFDIVFTGHDHSPMNNKVVNIEGDTVLVLNAGSRSEFVARVDIFRSADGNRKDQKFVFQGELVETSGYSPDQGFVAKFSSQYDDVKDFVTRVIGEAPEEISSRQSLFGPSEFVNLIHTLQLDLTGADISFAAPLSFDVSIPAGEITVGDMFKLYRYENMLYKMKLTGREIDGFLEHSVSGWFNTMQNADDYMLRYRTDESGKPIVAGGRLRLSGPIYNFDSAAGIDYTVDVSRPHGDKISISSLSDGRSFYPDSTYSVAINSYRGSGGGGHIRNGSGLSSEEAIERLISSTDRDLRFYFIEWIEKNKELNPIAFNNWKVVPKNFYEPAFKREYNLIYGSEIENK